jgi:hypothetical protein
MLSNGESPLISDGQARAMPDPAVPRYALHLITVDGDRLVEVRSSRGRSLAAEHMNAVARYARGDDPAGEGLRRFRGKRIAGYRLVDDRDLDLIDEFLNRGDLDWPDFYERV